MPLDSFYPFAEGDIEKFCRIDWDSIRQKIIREFMQIVHVDVRARSITADGGLRIFFSFYGYGTGNGTGTGYSGFSCGLSVGLSYGRFSNLHIEKKICVCYNASRQSEVSSPWNLTTTKTPVRQHWGFLFLLGSGKAYTHRLVTDYLSPSNHLQMRWQITPATTAIISEVNISMELTPFLSPV